MCTQITKSECIQMSNGKNSEQNSEQKWLLIATYTQKHVSMHVGFSIPSGNLKLLQKSH
jgi:hypothetical protein